MEESKLIPGKGTGIKRVNDVIEYNRNSIFKSSPEKILPKKVGRPSNSLLTINQSEYTHHPEFKNGKLDHSLKSVEQDYILYIYHRYNENITKTCKALKIGRSTLQRKLKEFGVR